MTKPLTPYRPSLAMQQAAQRAAIQPRLMTLTTKVLSTVGSTTRYPQAGQR